MTAKTCILILGVLLSAALCKAEDVCPWINATTVVDVPDPAVSDVQSAVTNGGDTCTFRYRKSDFFYSVRIAIHTAAGDSQDVAANATQCASGGTPLAGIGNEAVLCNAGPRGARVVGRVRDRIFVVNVSVKTAHGSTEMAKLLGDMATMMAEQVAGNLF